ncbi:MAG: DUF2283 domain-containing protein [Chloroflexi bacterium]|nr:DUF2283 domain-containing protein [Chloroflexota bacterium]
MKLEIDRQVHAAYVYVRGDESTHAAHTKPVDPQRIIDYDEQGRVLGIEFLGTDHGVDISDLPGLTPDAHDQLVKLFEVEHIPVYA